MIYEISQSWFTRRWHVYLLAVHGEWQWVASFKHEGDANAFVGDNCGVLAARPVPA